MKKINKNSAGLAVGAFMGIAHLVWAILVALKLAKPLMDWILSLHFMELSYTMQPFAAGTAVFLVAVTFLIGYVFGWVVAACWNTFVK